MLRWVGGRRRKAGKGGGGFSFYILVSYVEGLEWESSVPVGRRLVVLVKLEIQLFRTVASCLHPTAATPPCCHLRSRLSPYLLPLPLLIDHLKRPGAAHLLLPDFYLCLSIDAAAKD